jgi:RNA polymerase sigma factor (sigma-70 family)
MTNRLNNALRHLQHHLAQPGDLADSELLARFVVARDEVSFAVLVRRHGPMVLGVCRRVLRHHQDAEDAFQAAFLVLARKAAAVRPDAVGSYLYAVAYRTALEARAVNARRRAREMQVENLPQPPVSPAEAQDWRPILDRELRRMPEKYRSPILLCDLAGQSRKEAARQLGLNEGTLSSRLATARQMLARRLARSGVTLTAGALAVGFSEEASAAVPMALLDSTARNAVLVACGQASALTTPAAALMQGVLKAMFVKKLTVVLGMVLAALVLGAGGLALRAVGQDGPAAPNLEELVGQLAQVSKQRADLDRQEQKLVAAIGAEARKQQAARATAVVSEREGKLIFVGTEVKGGEALPEDRLVKPEPVLAFLAVQAGRGDADTFTLPDSPTPYRRWKEGETPEPGKCQVVRQPRKVRKLQLGDKVERGQLVALISPSLAVSKLEGALAKLDAAHAEWAAARTVRDTSKQIYDTHNEALRTAPGSISKADYLKARLDWVKAVEDEKVKAAAVRSAQADCTEAATLLLMYEVRSAVDGVVTAIHKRPGEMVKVGDTVLQVREP